MDGSGAGIAVSRSRGEFSPAPISDVLLVSAFPTMFALTPLMRSESCLDSGWGELAFFAGGPYGDSVAAGNPNGLRLQDAGVGVSPSAGGLRSAMRPSLNLAKSKFW